jgi:hypothetical protein
VVAKKFYHRDPNPLLSVLDLRPTQPLTEWVSGALSPEGLSDQGLKLIIYLNPVPRLRMSRAVLLIPQYAFMASIGSNITNYL